MSKTKQDVIDKARDLLNTRQQAFNQVFSLEGQHTKRVLEDLAKFCRAEESTFHPDARVHAVIEGRREVWLRIQRHLNLSPEELFEYYLGKEAKDE